MSKPKLTKVEIDTIVQAHLLLRDCIPGMYDDNPEKKKWIKTINGLAKIYHKYGSDEK